MASGVTQLAEQLLGRRFVVEGDLGAGAFGRVVRAHDSLLDRAVAVKLVPMKAPGSLVRDELLREARAASAAGPSAATVFDVVQGDDGLAIIMELIPGGSLLRVVGTRTPTAIAHRLGRAAVASMAAVHSQGVMHLDLHPGNLLLRADGTVAVADFGLAMLRQRGGFSRGGHELSWTAPELLGYRVPSPQADVFALGLILRWIERRTHASFGPVVARACAARRSDRPKDAGEMLAELVAEHGDGQAAQRGVGEASIS